MGSRRRSGKDPPASVPTVQGRPECRGSARARQEPVVCCCATATVPRCLRGAGTVAPTHHRRWAGRCDGGRRQGRRMAVLQQMVPVDWSVQQAVWSRHRPWVPVCPYARRRRRSPSCSVPRRIVDLWTRSCSPALLLMFTGEHLKAPRIGEYHRRRKTTNHTFQASTTLGTLVCVKCLNSLVVFPGVATGQLFEHVANRARYPRCGTREQHGPALLIIGGA